MAENGNPVESAHIPVMLAEVLEYLAPRPGGIYVDCTLGLGGHTKAIAELVGPTGRVYGIEQDEDAIKIATQRLQGLPVTIIKSNFRDLDRVISDLSVDGVDGFLFDLGVSSLQLDTPERGFSFRFEAPLDMRMDRNRPTTAADVVNRMSEEDLRVIFIESGYGSWARRIAKAITAKRQLSPINTTTELVALITATVPSAAHSKINVATLAFQSLRIVANDELAALTEALIAATNYCNIKARIAVVSFHSLEDRVTKRTLQYLCGKRPPRTSIYEPDIPAPPRLLSAVTNKPLLPSREEQKKNPRSRSAKLRVVERTDFQPADSSWRDNVPRESTSYW